MIVDKFGREWKDNDVVIWFGPTYIREDGTVVPDDWEMICPARHGKCIEHFKSKEEVEEYAKKHNFNILKWDMD